MKLLRQLWSDEAGVILSAEAALVGTVAVIGVSTGFSVVATSVNEELKDVGFAIRSLDQSYNVPGVQGCCAFTAGSSFEQQPVGESLAELCDAAKSVESHSDGKKAANADVNEKASSDRKKDRTNNRDSDSKKKIERKL